MALFGKKTEKTKVESAAQAPVKAPAKKQAPAAPKLTAGRDLSSVLLRPRITEKAITANEKNIYVFEVHKDANKYDVSDAVYTAFKVRPVKVRMVVKQPRTYTSRMRGKRKAPGLKKAYVYLKKGDSINF